MRKLTQKLIDFHSNRDAYMGWSIIPISCPFCKSGYLEAKNGKAFCCFCKKEVKPEQQIRIAQKEGMKK